MFTASMSYVACSKGLRSVPKMITARRIMTSFRNEVSSPKLDNYIEKKSCQFPKSHAFHLASTFSTAKLDAEFGRHDSGTEDNKDEEYRYQNHHDKRTVNETSFSTLPNPGLVSVISQGMKSLEQTADDIQYKTRKDTLSQAHKKPSFRNGRASEMDPRQLAEGQRILDVASECLEQLALQEEQGKLRQQSSAHGGGNGLILFGEPIVLLECEVNRNVRQARIYWTLPHGILLDNRINQRLYQEIMAKVQKELVENGGAKLLSREVHNRLSYYYPPRIKLYPATDEMIQKAIEEFLM